MSQPLEGIRVLELGNFIAGPFCGMLLGDMGADVIKIERPARGDQTRAMPPLVNGESASFAALNRNKRSLVLDLKQAEAREVVLALVKKSDVFLENNRPGALDGIGLGPEQVRAVNPDIVYTSASGFGQTGPYRRRAGVNLIVEAFSGALSVTGLPDDMPMRTGIQTADIFGALFAAYATLSGLVGKLRGRGGRTADVSLVEASISAAAWETAFYLATGEVPVRCGHQHRLNTPYQLFETSDASLPRDRHAERRVVPALHEGDRSGRRRSRTRALRPMCCASRTKPRCSRSSRRRCAGRARPGSKRC